MTLHTYCMYMHSHIQYQCCVYCFRQVPWLLQHYSNNCRASIQLFSWQSGNVSETAVKTLKMHMQTYTHKQSHRLTCEVISRPGAQVTGSAGILVKHKLIFFTGSTRPAAAHLTFTDHLEEAECTLALNVLFCSMSILS